MSASASCARDPLVFRDARSNRTLALFREVYGWEDAAAALIEARRSTSLHERKSIRRDVHALWREPRGLGAGGGR